MSDPVRVVLEAADMPRQWYNLNADFRRPAPPPIGPDGKPVGPEMLAPVFPMNLIEQEVSTQRWIDIPEPVQEVLRIWRPSPLQRAVRLEQALGTPARIFYKNEGVSPAGSHKPNTAIAQAYYNKVFGIQRMVTETGAGQWGSALAMSCKLMGLECKVYMVRISFDQKPFRKIMMRTWGAECVASPSTETHAGRAVLAQDPNTPGSLAIAISEAIESAVTAKDKPTRYGLGSVLNHVMLHQTIIGLETRKQFEKIGLYPDVVIGCCGGGSNFAGMSFPFVCDKIHGKNVRIVGVEPAACPSMTRGQYAYDSGDVAVMTPLLAMHTLGHTFVPAPIHAGGLRYHGMAPMVSHALREGLIEAAAIPQNECYQAAVLFAHTEGFIPAPETSHAIAQTIREAKRAKEEGKAKTVVMNWSGHGLMDLSGYQAFFDGKLSDYVLPEAEIKKSLASVAGFPKPPA
jgi:tryptophan synthase beta chain